MNPPQIIRQGPGFNYLWPEWGLNVELGRIYQTTRFEVFGEITIEFVDGPVTSMLLANHRYQLTSERARAGTISRCEQTGKDLPWGDIIETISVHAIRSHRRGGSITWLNEEPKGYKDEVSYLVDPIIVQGQPNMLFGDGGLGKSLAAIWMASMVTEGWQAPWPTMPGRVLYLDWEADHAEHHRRLKRIANGLGFDSPSAIGHRRCVGALAGDTEILSRAVKKYAIDMVIVDSANPACGGLPNDLDAVQNFFTALRHMEVTSLIIAHVPKGPDGQPRNDPFGSVHWKNLCRNVWQIAKDSDMDASSMKLALWHRKSNEGPLRRPIALDLLFGETDTVFRLGRIGDSDEFAKNLPLGERLSALLSGGALEIPEIAETLNVGQPSVRTVLNRKKDRFVKLSNGAWGLGVR